MVYVRLDGNPLILGGPCLEIVVAYIGYHEGNMTIAKGDTVKNLVLYPPAKTSPPIVKIHKQLSTYLNESVCSPRTVAGALEFNN